LVPIQAERTTAGVLVLSALGLVLALPALRPVAAGGVSILASDWLVPHGPWLDVPAAGMPWLLGGSVLFAALLGLCIPRLAALLDNAQRAWRRR